MRSGVLGFWIVAVVFFAVSEGKAQNQQNEAVADSVVHAFLPYVKFDSDIGLEGGVSLNRYHYEEEVRPFNTLTEVRLRATTRGLFSTRLAWETVDTFGAGMRSRVEFIGERMLNDTYFAPGNDSPFSEAQWEQDYHFFDALGFELTYDGRYPLLKDDPNRFFDLLVLGGGITRQAFGDDEENIMGNRNPLGQDGGLYLYFGTGLLYDSRENEFDPRSGNYSRFEITGSPALLGEYSMMKFMLETSQFYSPPFSDNLTLAGRLQTAMTTGQVPFWMLPEVGGELTVRGYPTGRFRDNGAVLTNFEIRKWLMSFDLLNLRAGLTAFTDSGRVFSELPDMEELFTDYHRTIGGGPIFSAFTDDFIIRAQIGRSEEMIRIYMNIGFSF